MSLWAVVSMQGRDITDVFVDMPDSLMPMLSQNARKDLIDFYKSGMKPLLPNEMSANSQLTKIEDNLLVLDEDSHGLVTTTMALLSLRGRDSIVCMIRTIKCPQPDSEIFFFTTSWQQLKTQKFLALPTSQETRTATEGSVVDYTSITLEVPKGQNPLLSVAIDASDGIVKDDADFGSKTDKKPTFRYEWNGTKFIKKQ